MPVFYTSSAREHGQRARSAKKRWTALASLLFLLAHEGAFARTIHYIANAVSNVTFEDKGGQGVMGFGCTWASNLFTCNLPSLKCRVMVQNPSPTGSSINVNVFMDHVIAYQTNTTLYSYGADPTYGYQPFVNTSGTDLSYSAVNNSGVKGWKGMMGSAGAMVADDDGLSVTLAGGEYYIFERYVDMSYTMTTDASANLTANPYNKWPFAKWFSTCSGYVEVTDVSSTSPGNALASGSLDYYLSSHQNQHVEFGGYNDVSTSLKEVRLDTSSTATSSGFGYSTCTGGAGTTARGLVYAFGRSQCDVTGTPLCSATINTHNGRKSSSVSSGNASRTWPLEIGKVPIFINGGAPF